MTSPTSVVVIDDHLSFSEAMGLAINAQEGLQFAGCAPTLAEGIELVHRQLPDVALLDVHLPDADGIEAIPRIRAASENTRVVILTGDTNPSLLAGAASAGACGFLVKGSSMAEVIGTIRAAGEGSLVINRSMLADLLDQVRQSRAKRDEVPATLSRLTEREQGVLLLLGNGSDPSAIAKELGISTHTVRSHVKSILMKLGVHSQLEAVVTAARHGLIPSLGVRDSTGE